MVLSLLIVRIPTPNPKAERNVELSLHSGIGNSFHKARNMNLETELFDDYINFFHTDDLKESDPKLIQ